MTTESDTTLFLYSIDMINVKAQTYRISIFLLITETNIKCPFESIFLQIQSIILSISSLILIFKNIFFEIKDECLELKGQSLKLKEKV